MSIPRLPICHNCGRRCYIVNTYLYVWFANTTESREVTLLLSADESCVFPIEV